MLTESIPATGKAGVFANTRLWMAVSALLGLLVVAGAVAWWLRSSASGDAPVRALQLETGEQIESPQVSPTEGAAPRLLLPAAADATISPDGRLLAYVSMATNKREVYLTTFPEPGQSWPVSVDGGSRPRWNPRGGELFFTSGPPPGDNPNGHRDLSVVKVELRGAMNIGKPERLFEPEALGLRATHQGFRSYDIAPDGQRILLTTTGTEGAATIAVIENLAGWLRQQK